MTFFFNSFFLSLFISSISLTKVFELFFKIGLLFSSLIILSFLFFDTELLIDLFLSEIFVESFIFLFGSILFFSWTTLLILKTVSIDLLLLSLTEILCFVFILSCFPSVTFVCFLEVKTLLILELMSLFCFLDISFFSLLITSFLFPSLKLFEG